jgi:hypothetical protein
MRLKNNNFVIYYYFLSLGSTEYLAFSQSAQPPFRAYTFLYPFVIICSATLALAASFTQAQYKQQRILRFLNSHSARN